jgi:hypothetical protein
MKRIAASLTTAVVLAFTSYLYAQAPAQSPSPGLVDYQGFVLDSAGNPLAPDVSGNPAPINYAMEFRIYDASSAGTLIWGEKQNVTVSAGKFSVQLGKGTVLSGSPLQPSDINQAFVGSNRFLGLTVIIPPATSGTEVVPRLQFLSSPFSFVANTAVNAQALSQSVGTASMTNASITNATIANATITAGVTGNGSGLTSLNATNMASGTLADARLSTNVALLNANQTFSGTNTFSSTSPLVLNRNDIQLGTAADNNKYRLGWYGVGKPFASQTYDGPVLAGDTGGSLGTIGATQKIALRWGDGFIGVPGNQYLEFAYGLAGKGIADSRIGFNFLGTGGLEFVGGGSTGHKMAFYNEAGATFTGPVTMTRNSASFFESALFVIGQSGSQIRFQSKDTGNFWSIGDDNNGDAFSFYPNTGAGAYIVRSNGSYNQNSDGRLKKDISEISNVLDKVLQLRPVSYRFKTNTESDPLSLGFIAQEVEPLFPEIVNERNGYKAMSYSEFIPLTVAAMQEEHRRNDERDRQKDSEIEGLKQKNADLERRLQALEEKLLK